MGADENNDRYSTGRRQFLKLLFGVGSTIETKPAEASRSIPGNFFWADLKSGQIGFPTGCSLPAALPGSLMKLPAAAAIRNEHLLPENTTFECTGTITIHQKRYNCQIAHGVLDLAQAIGHSCNVFFAQAAESLGCATFLSYACRFGLDRAVAGFASGPFPAECRGTTQQYVLGLSEDFQPHALQILQMSALIATRGRLPSLHSAEDPNPAYVSPVLHLKDSTWELLSHGMQLSCRMGTAHALDPGNKLHLAVKTGTAPYGKTFQSWATGYFPAESPRYAFCARAQVGTSQTSAVPLAHQYLFATNWP